MGTNNTILNRISFILFSLLSNFRVSLVGQIPISELIALASSVNLSYWKKINKIQDLFRINIAYIVFFISQLISDIVNSSSTKDSIRGWANIIMALIVTNYIYFYFRKANKYIIIFLIGQLISLILFTPDTFGDSIYEMSFFKFRVVPVLNNAILLFSYFLLVNSTFIKKYQIVSIILFVYGGICLALDSRSNGLLIILTAIIFSIRFYIYKLNKYKLIFSILIFAGFFQILYSVYVFEVLKGHIGGEHAQSQMIRLKDPYNPLNLLESGRSEVFVAMYAIADKPLFGHGSWAPDKDGKYTAMTFKFHNDDEKFDSYYLNSNELIIPSHSIILGAWMTAGVLGFICIFYVFIIFLKRSSAVFKSLIILNNPVFPIFIFFFLNIIWNMFFSPLPHMRQTLSYQLAMILMLSHKIELYNRKYRLNE